MKVSVAVFRSKDSTAGISIAHGAPYRCSAVIVTEPIQTENIQIENYVLETMKRGSLKKISLRETPKQDTSSMGDIA